MKILCIETATEVCSVCVSVDGRAVGLRENLDGNQHSRVLTLLIGESVREAGIELADLDAVALSAGPGSYTSMRVGASAAKGICFALGLPLIAVPTLESLAHAARLSGEFPVGTVFFPMIDARRMEVWAAGFDLGGKEIEPAGARVIDHNSFEEFVSNGRQLVLLGSGAEKCRAVLAHPGVVFLGIRCSAAHLSLLSFSYFQNKWFQDVAYFEPTYIKPPNVTSPSNRLTINELKKN